MANPTASETTHATNPAPYPIIVPSSTVAALAAKGAIAVAKAATAAAFFDSNDDDFVASGTGFKDASNDDDGLVV